jgi:pilus assembly protein CpaB
MLVLVSLTLGAVAAMGANNWLNNQLLAGESDADVVVVVSAALDIPYGTKVDGRHLRLVEMPRGTEPANVFHTTDEVEGRVARVAIEQGEVLLASRFVEHEEGSTLAALVTENMRAITVRVNEVVGVAGFLLPGNRVDVISIRGGRGNTRASSETVLNNIKVLAVDQTTATEQNDPIIVRAVTLELSPPQALVLVKAKAEGQIQLTLRNPLDSQIAQIEPEPKPVAKAAPIVRKYRPAPATPTVQVIRGTKVNKEKGMI